MGWSSTIFGARSRGEVCVTRIGEGPERVPSEFYHMGGPPKIMGKPPKSSHFNRVFHEINHPFWGTPSFGNIHIHLKRLHRFPSSVVSRAQPTGGVSWLLILKGSRRLCISGLTEWSWLQCIFLILGLSLAIWVKKGYIPEHLPSLKLTWHLKNDGWKM